MTYTIKTGGYSNEKTVNSIFSIALSLSLMTSCIPTIFAASADAYIETTEENHQVIRTLERSSMNRLSANKNETQVFEATVQELLMLGMEECFIENMSNE